MSEHEPTSPDHAMTAMEPRSFQARYQTLLSLFAPALLLGVGRGFTTPVLPGLAIAFGANVAGAGLMVIAPMVGGVLATLPTGYLIDRIGRRKILIAGPLLTSLSALLILRASTYAELLIYLSIGGIAQQMWQMGRLATIADSGAPSERGRQITAMGGAQRLGGLVGPLVGGVVGEAFGLRVPFALYGVAALLATVPTYLLIKETAPTVLAGRRGLARTEASADTSWSKLLTPRVLILFVAQFTANVGRGGPAGHSGPYFIFAAYAFGAGPATIGAISFASGLVGVPIMLLAGQIMDRLGRKWTIVPASALLGMGLGFMAFTAAAQLSFSSFVAAFVFINLAVSLMAGSMQTLGSDVAPPEARGKFFGVIRLIGEAGSLGNPASFSIATALVAGSAGFASAFGIMGGFALFTAGLVGLAVKETLRKC